MDKELEKLLDEKRAYIFDLDGTLADSEKLQWEAHKIVLKDMFGIDLDMEHIYSYLGMADVLLCKTIEKDFGIDMGGEKGYEKYSKARTKTAFKLVKKNAVPFKYVTEVLANAGLGKRWYLVTAQNPGLVKDMLKKWGFMKYFNPLNNVFICDATHNKMYYYDEIVKLLKNAKPEEIVLFEDVNKYLEEGRKRGFKTVGIDNNFGKDPIVADVVIHTQE